MQRLGRAGVLEGRLRRGGDVHPRLHDLALVEAEEVDGRAQVARERLELVDQRGRRADGPRRGRQAGPGGGDQRRGLAQQRPQVRRQRDRVAQDRRAAAAPPARARGRRAPRRRRSRVRRTSVGRSSSRNVGSSLNVRCRSASRAAVVANSRSPAVISVRTAPWLRPSASNVTPVSCTSRRSAPFWRVEDRQQAAAVAQQRPGVADDVVEVLVAPLQRRRHARDERLQVAPRRGRERADDLVELGRRLHLRVGQPPALGQLRRAA